MSKKKIIIGTRGSKLALIYANIVKKKLFELKNKYNFEDVIVQKIKTDGDKIQDVRLSDTGGKGLFSKKIEEQLIKNNIDVAVHALKDMPSLETKGLLTECFLKRNDPREVLISKNNEILEEQKKGAIIGTSSLRREFQVKRKINNFNFKLIRGNVDTRIKKLNDGLYDGIILSLIGLKFLGLEENVSQIFSTSEMIPSVGQGVIAVQCRKDDLEIRNILENLNHDETKKCVNTERNILKILDGDCDTAIGAYAKIEGEKIYVEAELFSLDGSKRFYVKSSKELKYADQLGKEVGIILKKKSKDSYKK